MSSIFHVDRITNDNKSARIAIAALSIIPLGLIFGAGGIWRTSSESGSTVVGRPPSWVFATTWAVIALCFIFITIVACFHSSVAYAAVLLTLSIALGLFAASWLYVYNQQANKSRAAQVLAATALVALVFWSTTLTASVDVDAARSAMAIPGTLVVFWTALATVLNYLEIQ